MSDKPDPQPSRDDEELSDAEAVLRSHLDREDFEIFRALNENGRMPDTELAERVGLSRTAARRRRQNMMDEGLLDILAVIVLQEGDLAYGEVLISLEPTVSTDDWPAIIETFVDADLVYSVDVAMGEYDIILHAWHESFHELKSYVWELFEEVSVVESYTFVPVVKTWKAWDKVLERP